MKILLLELLEEGSLLLHVTGRIRFGGAKTEISGGFVTGFFKKTGDLGKGEEEAFCDGLKENEEQIGENRAIHMRICVHQKTWLSPPRAMHVHRTQRFIKKIL